MDKIIKNEFLRMLNYIDATIEYINIAMEESENKLTKSYIIKLKEIKKLIDKIRVETVALKVSLFGIEKRSCENDDCYVYAGQNIAEIFNIKPRA